MSLPKKPRNNCPVCQHPVANLRCVYCSIHCQMENQYRQFIKKWLVGEVSGTAPHGGIVGHVRRYLFERSGSKCEKCGWSEVNPVTNKVPLTINHIDGVWRNTTLGNVELICPNCHSLTPNFGALNQGKGSGRKRGRSRLVLQAEVRSTTQRVQKEKGNWPSRDQLAKRVWESPVSVVAIEIGVSNSRVKTRCKKWGISTRPRGYWMKIRSSVLTPG